MRTARDAVDAFLAAALANGATVRGEPGVWPQYSKQYYAAFVNDLHGNNVEAVWHAPEPVTGAPVRRSLDRCLRRSRYTRLQLG